MSLIIKVRSVYKHFMLLWVRKWLGAGAGAEGLRVRPVSEINTEECLWWSR